MLANIQELFSSLPNNNDENKFSSKIIVIKSIDIY
jgi:hypothetical protein